MTAGRTGRVIVVTGAGQGQGAAFARALAAEGGTVVGLDVTAEPAEELPGVEFRQQDVADAAGWQALGADLAERYGRVDGLVANAGITWRERVTTVDPADLARVYAVNVTGTVLGIQTLAPLMTGGGSIVVVGSVAALTGHYAVAYTASKWALRGVAKAASLELGPRAIRVNTVHPGWIETAMSRSARPAFRTSHLAETPLGRVGTIEDIVPLVRFLLSDDASYITGAEIAVDGGMSAHGGVKSISDALAAAP
ncbi:MAG TPA: SDR family NAD(P)-dependent oxidoreductase [Mycobacteriales bacterium]|nr:SDR family NAD(P)-dependent oxidoreductase [Mycobacteriales bacterium]